MDLQKLLARLSEATRTYGGFSSSRMANRRQLKARAERIPTTDGSHVDIVTVEIIEQTPSGPLRGRAETTPSDRFGESIESVFLQIEGMSAKIEDGLPRDDLRMEMPKGAARNAIDCAFWDLEAKRSGSPVWQLLGLSKPPAPVMSAFAIQTTTPEETGKAARAASGHALLRLVIPSGDNILPVVQAVRNNAPHARLIIDASEKWSSEQIGMNSLPLAGLGVEFILQPLPAGEDGWLSDFYWGVPLCADASCTDATSLARIKGRYHAVNICLEKAGGLTEALELKAAAESQGYAILVSARPGTSLGLAPALLLAQGARAVDFSACPQLGAADRNPPLHRRGSLFHPAEPALWG